ncbi:GMC family oxidoreductase N-terminal domain-containing protein [Advenella sp. WQ 585]|uniref:GMC family oxidoreductase N-terminal domain-containing protein n=1 Tax=Advenella mandrilli TaxID=2800330 RepID=A0ABS1EFP5_9BURK|nr:GMC family oxidoreductase N-terminal domain-containing protein [Advenella mandrilli]MBK1781436.1 GMC family oxidoreductase N-terminal domain-containing protein [Advenella mandrilli]NLY33280.1 choline dehydrogenase [Alcaligenaceae bacterium]
MHNQKPVLFGEFDYIIVGAGSAGCLLANRLSANPDNRVLLLEAGGPDSWHWLHIPVGYLYCIGNPRADWCFRTRPDAGLHDRSIAYPRGKVLGGSSAINGMIYMRGQKQDYDYWASLGNTGWAWDDVLPLFKGFENHHLGNNDWHGTDGELRVENQRLRWDILDAFRAAAAQAGIFPIDDFNRGDNEGSAYFEVTQKKGLRFSAAKAFLHPVKSRKNLTILMHATSDRIIFEGKRARGIQYYINGKLYQANARAELVLSAGAIGSVQILQRSGIGPASYLNKLHIPVVHHAPEVGKNLQDHLQLRTVYKVSGVKTLNKMMQSPLQKAWMGMQYALFRKGPLTMAPSQLGVFARSTDEQGSANLEYHVQPLSLEKFGEPLHAFAAFTASVCNLRPTSRGEVNIVSSACHDKPDIMCNYLSTDEDIRIAVQSLKLTRRIVFQDALATYNPIEYKPGTIYQSEEDLVRAAGEIGTTIFHPVGTCRMGTDDKAVVDPELKVNGVSGLRVIDASIMPQITSGNTNAPVMMIAEKGARMILASR